MLIWLKALLAIIDDLYTEIPGLFWTVAVVILLLLFVWPLFTAILLLIALSALWALGDVVGWAREAKLID